MRPHVVFHLQAVFNVAKKTISVGQTLRFIGGEPIVLHKLFKRRQGLRSLKKWLTTSMNELKRLCDELNFTNAAATELHIALKLASFDDFVLDTLLHRSQLAQKIFAERAWVAERLDHLQKFVRQ